MKQFIAFSWCFSLISALAFHAPVATPAWKGSQVDPQGWSPRPTEAPSLEELRKRQNSQSLLLAPDGTCGYISGLSVSPFGLCCDSCTCGFATTPSSYGAFYCCNTATCENRIPTTCIDNNAFSVNGACGSNCVSDLLTLKCTISPYVYCNLAEFEGVNVQALYCDSVTISGTQSIFTTYAGEVGRILSTFTGFPSQVSSSLSSTNPSLLSSSSTTLSSSSSSASSSASSSSSSSASSSASSSSSSSSSSSLSSSFSSSTTSSSLIRSTTTSRTQSQPVSSTQTTSSIPTSPTNSSSSAPIGAIVGGSVGGAAVLAIIGVLVFLCCSRRRASRSSPSSHPDYAYYPTQQDSAVHEYPIEASVAQYYPGPPKQPHYQSYEYQQPVGAVQGIAPHSASTSTYPQQYPSTSTYPQQYQPPQDSVQQTEAQYHPPVSTVPGRAELSSVTHDHSVGSSVGGGGGRQGGRTQKARRATAGGGRAPTGGQAGTYR